MLEYVKNLPARIPIRLLNVSGSPVPGVVAGSVSVTIEKADGTVANVTIDGVNTTWAEVTTGTFASQGKYDLVLAASYMDVLGPMVISVAGGSGVAMGLIQVATLLDSTPPVIQNFSPSPGSPVVTTDPITFEVVDNNNSIRRVIIAISYGPNRSVDVAFDGNAFRPPYSTSSVRTTLVNGSRFTLRRDGGWPATPVIEVYAIDTSGNEAA
jgi:hypothetical protein